MISAREKQLYNTYLRISRQYQNKPYKLRENFKGFENEDKYVYVQRLTKFFQRHPNIRWDEFFEAPFKIYPEKTFYDLKFYSSMKAVKVYKLYKTKQERKQKN